jgi:hypothetical protein
LCKEGWCLELDDGVLADERFPKNRRITSTGRSRPQNPSQWRKHCGSKHTVEVRHHLGDTDERTDPSTCFETVDEALLNNGTDDGGLSGFKDVD